MGIKWMKLWNITFTTINQTMGEKESQQEVIEEKTYLNWNAQAQPFSQPRDIVPHAVKVVYTH